MFDSKNIHNNSDFCRLARAKAVFREILDTRRDAVTHRPEKTFRAKIFLFAQKASERGELQC